MQKILPQQKADLEQRTSGTVETAQVDLYNLTDVNTFINQLENESRHIGYSS